MRCSTLVLVFLVAGCDFLHDPIAIDVPESPVIVHSILRSGSDTVSVLITRARMDEFDQAPELAFVSDALVNIIMGSDTTHLVEGPPGFSPCIRYSTRFPNEPIPGHEKGSGCYAATVPGGVRPGETYQLRIELPDGTRVTGAAVIPPPPIIEAPDAGARLRLISGLDEFGEWVQLTELPVRWNGAVPGGATEVALVAGAVFQEGSLVLGGGCDISEGADFRFDQRFRTRDDSMTVQIMFITCFSAGDRASRHSLPVWDSIRARLVVSAYDSAYTNFRDDVLSAENTIRADHAGHGLAGASGVFAGFGTALRRITILPDAGYSERQIEYMANLALGPPGSRIRKWSDELRIRVHGLPSASDSTALATVSAEIEALAGDLRISIGADSANVDLYVIPQSEFGTFEPNYSGESRGFFWVWWNGSYDITRARIMIASDAPAGVRSHLIRRLLTYSLGFFYGSRRYEHSIFYSDSSAITSYAPIDRRVIRMLYRDEIWPGMTRDAATTILRRLERPRHASRRSAPLLSQ